MATCVDGHQTLAEDFCDQCGMPIADKLPAPTPSADPVSACPNCGAPHVRDALFCESCGYDYTTGALPTQDLRTELGLPPLPEPDVPDEPTGGVFTGGQEESDNVTQEVGSTPASDPVPATSAAAPAPAAPLPAKGRHIPWVAEVWVDPQWYAFQESDDTLPPLGAPRIVALKDSALIGRRSVSRNILPDIDCESDSGVSRRHAFLTSADGYWYVNDLDSANGTFVAHMTGSLPDEPIAGRTRVGPDKRIYVGGWTRIVVRPALPTEIASAT